MNTTKTKTEHTDIRFLRLRLEQLLHDEEYENCARVHKWIEELIKYYDTIRHDKTNR